MSESQARSLEGLRVMIAEDDRLIAELVHDVLLTLGCSVIGPVGTLDEALLAIRTQDLDGAVLDVQLGHANIFPAASELALRGTPFILMTGHGHISLPALFNNAPLLPKPFRVQQLEDIIINTFRLREPSEPQQP